MGYRFNSFYRQEQHPFVKAMINVLTESSRRSARPAFATKLMAGTNAQLAADIALQRSIGAEIIDKRRLEGPTSHQDLLDHMMNGKDPKTGKLMDDALISANMQTFLIAGMPLLSFQCKSATLSLTGHETASSLLSFVMYNLIRSPAAYVAAQKEVDEVIGEAAIEIGHLKKLKYVNAVLREALLLWPPAPAFSRSTKPHVQDDVVSLGGYTLPKGVPVMALLGKTHRDPDVYGDDADEFKPERMLDEKFEKLPKNAWKVC